MERRPASRRAGSLRPALARDEGGGSNAARSILLVEDSRFFATVVSDQIRSRLGIEVVHAASFEAARAVMEGATAGFDLAVVDLLLPDSQDGETIEYLLERGVPSIVFTAQFSQDLRERILSLDALDYIVKDEPASVDRLVNLIDRVFKNRDCKVMVVEDSKLARRLVSRLLTHYRFNVIEAENGREALEKLGQNPDIRLIITDYHMPEMDGIEMIKQVRKSYDQDEIAIIGVSSAGSHSLSAQFLKYGANDFLVKPFLPEEFFCRVLQNVRMLDLVGSLRKALDIDFLTRLHNRRYLFEAGETLLALAKRGHFTVAAAMIDVDHFKAINDSLGHAAGDDVLRQVAAILQRETRQGDLVARFGGEEFALIAVNVTDELAAGVFERYRVAVSEEPLIISGSPVPVTVSIGVSVGVKESLSTMLSAADDLLYRAKREGRNRVVVG